MDKRNLKKPEQSDRKQERKDRGDLKKVEKHIKKIVDSDTNVSKHKGDLKKAEKQTKNVVDSDTNDATLSPDKGDLKKTEKQVKNLDVKTHADTDMKKTEKQPKKLVDSDTNVGKIHPDRGDLKKSKKVVDSDTIDGKLPPDRGDLKKTEKQAKKVVDPDVKMHADRGDLKKNEKQPKKLADSDTNVRKIHPDRGDLKKSKKLVDSDTNDSKISPVRDDLKKTEKQSKKLVDSDTNDPKFQFYINKEDSDRKVTKVDKPKFNVITKKSDDKTKNVENLITRENVKKLDIETVKTVSDDRRKIREKYNFKLKVPSITPNLNKREEQAKLGNSFKPVTDTKNDRTLKKPNVTAKDKSDESNESKQSLNIINIIKTEKKDSVQRKPIIRTISSRNDSTKIYKAVTFVDQRRKPTMLQIKIPSETKKPKNFKSTETMTSKKVKSIPSGISVKEKTLQKKLDRKKPKNRHVTSPDASLRVRSPPTEVAKWAPSSINRHTKPYYEAWVSTTLAAISKNSKKDKLFLEKQNILQSFQRALTERPETPELVYENYTDERYTGKIKVKQR